jgi:hypothetical protein
MHLNAIERACVPNLEMPELDLLPVQVVTIRRFFLRSNANTVDFSRWRDNSVQSDTLSNSLSGSKDDTPGL